MSLLRVLVFFAILCCPYVHLSAQPSVIPEAPVRYDQDLLPASFHADRRAKVLAQLPNRAFAVFFSAPARLRENDTDYEYCQDSDLYYLTGTHEAGTLLVLAPDGIPIGEEVVNELLFVPPRNASREIWNGRVFGAERAQQILGVQKAVDNSRFEEIMVPLMGDTSHMFFHLPLPHGFEINSALGSQVNMFKAYAHPLDFAGNRMLQSVWNVLQTASNDDDLNRLRPLVERYIDPETIQDEAIRAAITAFIQAGAYADWQLWKRENLDGKHADGTLLRAALDELRMIKTEEELAVLQKAIDVTVAAHREVIKSIEPGMHEYEAEALIEYIFKRNGAEDPGFSSIVGSGENAVILHYGSNRRQMQAGDMVVMDIGAEYHGYSADITRSVPVSGVFSAEQKAIYEIVLRANEAATDAARAGNPFPATNQAATRIITEGLLDLGLIQAETDVRTFFMHGVSHYLGLYVHDVGNNEALVPGTVITIEPGIYISPSPDVDPKWWNIGIRIEDDVLVTDGDPVVLSAEAPRTIDEIEALMAERGLGNEKAGLLEVRR